MQSIYDNYNYRRFLKHEGQPRPVQLHPQTDLEQTGRNPTANITRLASPQRSRTLLKSARAERALQLQQITEPTHPEFKPSALMWNDMGLRQLENGDLPRAFRNFQQAIIEDSSLSIAYNNMGLLYLEIGDLEQAKRHLDIAVALQPSMDAPRSNRGLAWMEAGHYQLAQWDFEEAIRLAPDDPLHHNNIGVLYLELGETKDAMAHLERAIQLNPRNPMHYSNRGMIHEAAGNPARANEDYIHAAQMAELQFQADMDETQA